MGFYNLYLNDLEKVNYCKSLGPNVLTEIEKSLVDNQIKKPTIFRKVAEALAAQAAKDEELRRKEEEITAKQQEIMDQIETEKAR